MSGCEIKTWKVVDLANAISNKCRDKVKLVIPLFQRGKRWGDTQERKFVDSLSKGYPIGTMLFYKIIENDTEVYVLVDGLQRGTCIRKYIARPADYFAPEKISDEFWKDVLLMYDVSDFEKIDIVRKAIDDFIKRQESISDMQYYSLAAWLAEEFRCDKHIEVVINKFKNFFSIWKENYERIAATDIPIVIYTGDADNLPEIFERINSQGTHLDKYEIYAASWPVMEKYYIKDTAVVDRIIKKYNALQRDNYEIQGYNEFEFRAAQKMTVFEFLFALSKELTNRYNILAFELSKKDDEVNPFAFELVNGCINEKNNIGLLYKDLKNIDLNELENAICNAIDFVQESIAMVTGFKGNNRKKNKTKNFHSKYQIISMIAVTFKMMYSNGNYCQFNDSWDHMKKSFGAILLHHYVYDIISNYWREGGSSKIFQIEHYSDDISVGLWDTLLDGYFENAISLKKDKAPASAEYIFLNCIYMQRFTAMDQLSQDKFDVEHIATKEQMKQLIRTSNGDGLPVGSVANLCYWPEFANRSKKDKNFYQDEHYINRVNLKEIETKYSFTCREDLDWMDFDYKESNGFDKLKREYINFCKRRFKKMKELFMASIVINLMHQDHVNNKYSSMGKTASSTVKENSLPTKMLLPSTELKIGLFVKTAMKNLSEIGYNFTEGDIQKMCSKELSKSILGLGVSFFRKCEKDNMSILDENGYQRYWKDKFKFGNEYFFISKEWFENKGGQRRKFIDWYSSLK